jgi:Carboxypeptidase regulatory-like domain/TonB-dependent Receptor Plug Domain
MTVSALRRHGIWFSVVSVALALLFSEPAALAQFELAGLSGRVTDPSGAVLAQAEVEVKNVETSTSVIRTTNSDGLYSIPSLRPGHYVISVRKQGFKTVSITELTLNIQDNVVRNFQMQVGSASESVTVTAEAFNINTSDASVSTVVDQSYVQNMPLNGRSFQDLILLTPGVVTQTPQISQNSFVSGRGLSGEFSVNGQRTESNNYTVDGVSANVGAAAGSDMLVGSGPTGSLPAATALGTTQALVSVDDLQEFRVQSSTYSAEYGRNPGGQFAFETKSGTNQWHGTAYDYVRNGFFDSQDWFNDFYGQKEPVLRQNDFGGTLGGSIRIPRLYNGKDKTFFFVSYEGLRLTSPQPTAVSSVPDDTTRTSVPAPLNQVMNAFPIANGPELLMPCDPSSDPSCPPSGQKPSGLAEYIATWSNPNSIDSTSVRFDHDVAEKMRLFFRFSQTTSSAAFRLGGGSSSGVPTVGDISDYTLRTYTAGVTSLLTNRISNEFRMNYSSNNTAHRNVIEPFGGSTPVDLQQLVGLGPDSLAEASFCPSQCGGLFQFKESGAQRQWNLVDTLNLSFGHHQFKFGADYRRLTPFAIQNNPASAYTYFSQNSVATNMADFVDWETLAPAYPLYTNLSAYAQDQWKASQRLSISLGLRWDVNPPPGVTQGLKPYTLLGSSPANWTLSSPGTPLWHTAWFNFAPRLGAAYTLRDRQGWETVVRGGGGVFFDSGQQLGSQSFNGPGFFAQNFNNFQPSPFPGTPVYPAINNPASLADCFCGYGFYSHLQLPYTIQWNASGEQALGKSQALTASYVGSHASRLLQRNLYLPASNPSGAFFTFLENGLTSDYHSAQVQYRRKLSQGLTALASYTWSHCIDYGSSNLFVGFQRGNCDFDVRHNFSSAFSYDLPNAGHNGFANAILHHWGIDDRFTARSGFPVTIWGSPIFVPVTGKLVFSGVDLVQGQPLYISRCASPLPTGPAQIGCPGGKGINPAAFTPVPIDPNTGQPTHSATAPRNFVRGFGAWQMDLAIRREFPIYERLKLQFRAEAFNAFNHPNFGVINNTNFGAPTFGEATATLANSLGVLSPLYQTGGPRSMQFALKLLF